MERFEGQPFELLGINSDGKADRVREIVQREGIPWRQAVDGSTTGPIDKLYRVKEWPTILVLDAEGIIRAKGARGEDLEKVVEDLLKK